MTVVWCNLIVANKLSGLICRECGSLIGTAGKGVPRDCDTCLATTAEAEMVAAQGAERERLLAERQCPHCGKILRSLAGRNQHMRVVHSALANEKVLA